MSNRPSAYELGQIARCANAAKASNPFPELRDRMEWEMGWSDEDKIIVRAERQASAQ